MSEEIKSSLIRIGLDSGVLNYIDHETPRQYFVAGWIDEECINDFAKGIVEQCIKIIQEQEATPVGFIQPKNSMIYAFNIRKHFELEELNDE